MASGRGGKRTRWTPPENDLPKLEPPPTGRPKNQEKAQAVRELLLRGATTGMVMKATGCGSSMITRIRREIQAEADQGK